MPMVLERARKRMARGGYQVARHRLPIEIIVKTTPRLDWLATVDAIKLPSNSD
jgi:hypothetical protein